MENTMIRKCFIITPIGDVNTTVRRKIDGLIDEVIEPLLSELGYTVDVSHRIADSGTMTPTIIKSVYESDLAIANLTGNNPNVIYEVALRHACAKPIIHIAENVSDLPFDINDQRTIQYTDDIQGAFELRNKLKKMIENITYGEPVSNPITDALEKKNLVNIPEATNIEFATLLTQIQNDIIELKNEMKRNNRNIKEIQTGKLKGRIEMTTPINSSISCLGNTEGLIKYNPIANTYEKSFITESGDGSIVLNTKTL